MILREIKNIYIKNRLTEGVDFKRYEWLKADIPIITLMMTLPISSKNFEFQRNFIQLMNSEYFGTSGSNNFSYFITDYGSYGDLKPLIWNGNSLSTVYVSSIVLGLGLHTIIANDNGVTISSVTNTASLPWYGSPNKIIFTNAGNVNKNTIHLTSSIKVDGVTRYVPCQLIKSIPASLDANNKSRAAGECGMYDSITGKFYGNVANKGTFTVEGDVEPETHTGLQQIYQNKLIGGEDYQTYDWLKGDGSAYINTNYLLDFDDIKTSVFRIYNTYPQVIEGARYEPQPTENNGAGTVIGLIAYNLTYSSFFSTNGNMARWNNNISANIENTVVMSKNGITLNGTNISSISENPIVGSRFDSVTPYLIFASWIHNWQIDNRRGKVDYKSFEIEGKLHLVPCTLLRSIPRNLDAQCKERQAGECGMIDLISGKFYGNVANSGTFTVENDNNE